MLSINRIRNSSRNPNWINIFFIFIRCIISVIDSVFIAEYEYDHIFTWSSILWARTQYNRMEHEVMNYWFIQVHFDIRFVKERMVHDVVECRYAAHANEEKRAFPDEKFRYRFGCEEHGLFYGRTAFNQRSIFFVNDSFFFSRWWHASTRSLGARTTETDNNPKFAGKRNKLENTVLLIDSI